MSRTRRNRAERGRPRRAEIESKPGAAAGTPGRGGSAVWSWLGLGAALLAAIFRLAPSLHFPFYNDDFVYMDSVRGRGWPGLLTHPMRVGGYLRPLSRDLHFKLLWSLFDLRPLGYHVVNLGLVLACIALVYAVGRKVLGPRAALLAASLFALTHVHAVLVAWASCDQDLWATGFALLSTWLFLSGDRAGIASASAFALALLSKESVFLLPAPLWLLASQREGRGAAFRRVLPHLGVLAAWGAIYVMARSHETSLQWDPGAMAWLPARFALAAAGFEGLRFWLEALGRSLAVVPILLAALCGAALLLLARSTKAELSRAIPWLAWCVAGLIPVLPVAHEWSGYYFAFPMIGLYLAVAALTEAVPGVRLAPLPLLLLLCGEATNRELLDTSAVGLDPSASAVNLTRLQIGWKIVARALVDLPAAVPVPEANSRFLFNGLPRRNGFISGDGPALRLMYADPSIGAAYLGDLVRPEQFKPKLYFFTWMGETGTFKYHPENLNSFKFDMELSQRLPTGIAAARYDIATRDSSAWERWNLGHLLREAGDTAASEREWGRLGVAALRDPAAIRAAVDRALATLTGDTRLEALMRLAFAAPTDPSPLAGLARHFDAGNDQLAVVMWYRACRMAPADTLLLREALPRLGSAASMPAGDTVRNFLARARQRGGANRPFSGSR